MITSKHHSSLSNFPAPAEKDLQDFNSHAFSNQRASPPRKAVYVESASRQQSDDIKGQPIGLPIPYNLGLTDWKLESDRRRSSSLSALSNPQRQVIWRPTLAHIRDNSVLLRPTTQRKVPSTTSSLLGRVFQSPQARAHLSNQAVLIIK
jgi:hypothetical protein